MDNIYRALTGVVIDPGHGGTDPGAVGNGLQEKDLNLLISQYMYDRFKELGVPVTITRDDDETLSPAERTERILAAYGNNPNVVVISNHINSGGGTGAEVIYALRNTDTLAKSILENLGAEGQTMRKYYQRRLPSNTSKDYYFIHRDTGVTEPVIVEYGFIDDTAENVQYLQDNYKRLAEAVVRAVANYKGIPYTSPGGVQSSAYTVKAGDSLYSIALKYGISVNELKNANNLTSNIIMVGQVLRIPSAVDETEENIYVVKSGDSLYSIAKKYNTTVDNLKNLNNLTSNVLMIGQKLLVPTVNNNSSSIYVVQNGDSLYKIAQKYNTTVNDIKSLNNLSSDVLMIGQTLKIPTNTSNSTTSGNNTTYTVKSGDSLYKIAQRYNTTVTAIKRLNGLSSDNLSIGQQLLIPSSTSETTYTVQSGDSLYSIAKKFNTTVDNLKELNNLSSTLLNIGQKLIVG